MARLFPPAIDNPQATAGEKRLFTVLEQLLLPHEAHWVWYEPSLPSPGGRGPKALRPDFVLLGPRWGLLVLEVKDWGAAALVGGDRERIRIRDTQGEPVPRPHPERQAREAALRVRDLLRARGLVHASGKHAGELVLPVNYGAVWAHLSRRELAALAQNPAFRLDAERGLTQDEIERDDEEGRRRLTTRLESMCEVTFPFDLDETLRRRVRAVLEPQLRFFDVRATPQASSPAPEPAPAPVTRVPLPELPGFWLDAKQTRMARSLASPRTLVYGPAGSGKTVFLVARAQYWLERRPESRVLFTCYNASLASHLRNVFALKGTPPDETHLFVRHYHDLCQLILGVGDIHERAPDFYAALEPKVLQELARSEDTMTFDCILVDEGQDFSRRMVEVLVRLLASGGELTLVCDPAQDIYDRWSQDNLAPLRNFETERLVDCYRNTAPIFALALSVLSEDKRREMGLERLEMTRPEDLGRQGPPPRLVALPGLDDLCDLIAGVAADLDGQGVPLSDLAVLYIDRHAIPNFPGRLRHSRWKAAADPVFAAPAPEEREAGERDVEEHKGQGTIRPVEVKEDPFSPERAHFARALEGELRARGIPADWITRDFASKASYDISKARLTLSTVHSAKGMDFHTVILLGAETLDPGTGQVGERSAELLFTAITRAREDLILPFFLDRGWVPELRARLLEIEGDKP